jgi:hypothetical protein
MSTESHPFGPQFVLGGVHDDKRNDVRFEVWAERMLTDAELSQALSTYLLSRRGREPLMNQTIRIQYTFGSER